MHKVRPFFKDLGLACATALQFLTIAPPLVRRPFSALEMGRAVGCFPIIGLLLGVMLAGLDRLLTLMWHGNALQAAVVLTAWVVLTGALHVDGFLDTCDGLFGGSTPERRLEIMRDSRCGSFAVIGGVLLMLLKFSALAAVPDRWAALLLAPTLARWCVSWAVIGFPYARSEGLGRVMKENSAWADFCLATIVTGAVAAVLAFFVSFWLPLCMAATILATWLLIRFVMTRIPGLTGDVYGAICESMEVLVLMLIATQLPN